MRPRQPLVVPVLLLLGAALLSAAVPAVAAPSVTPSRSVLTVSPGQLVRVKVVVRGVARCTMAVGGRRTAVGAAGKGSVALSLRIGRSARPGVRRLRVSCPPVRSRVVTLRVRAARGGGRPQGGGLLSGPIVAEAVAMPKSAAAVRGAPAVVSMAIAGDGGGPAAAFTASPGPGTVTTLDASGSQGTQLRYAWQVDGVPGPTGATARIQPTVGVHRIKLTVTDGQGRTAASLRDVALTWRGTPYTAQVDKTNGFAGGGLALPQLAPALDATGPWRAVSCLNNGYAYQPQGDGSVILEVHQGDHPGTTGGDRCGLDLNEAYTPAINPNGNIGNQRRFYRLEFRLPPDQPAVPYSVNNFAEWHGKAAGGSVMTIGTDAVTKHVRVTWTPLINGVWQKQRVFDTHPFTPGVWENYVLEAVWSPNPSVGYFRIWRDGVNRTLGAPGADAEGRIFGPTAKTFADGSTEPTNFSLQNYRPKTGPIDPATGLATVIPPTRVQYRNTMIGPTLASVTGPR